MYGSASSDLRPPAALKKTSSGCYLLASIKTRGDLGRTIAGIVLAFSYPDLQQMKWNYSEKIRNSTPGYRKRLEETITGTCTGSAITSGS